ncbi:3-hydroxyacyl-CoA dehydrogenase NAD-binding domain-containing protein [Sphingobium sp.]|uniref:3-hydroxyacyl-CoA dehydrogenase n=1 Tax=Sphingobium sp. TaxID=1912891 RepID=UPI0028BE858F|nr:3-hydroxyacyl-CoA dehydrogenase NAD-binding domain-containing protein [Sphingobium sp.]
MTDMSDSLPPAREYAGAAEALAWTIDNVAPDALPADIGHVCVIGGGQMGCGIATALLDAGLQVTLMETETANLERAAARIRANWANRVRRGQMSEAEVDERMERLSGVTDLASAPPSQLFIEAVWENMALKKQIFARLAEIAPAGAVLATNSSTLDIDAIAAVTNRPEDVIGLHFFSPAHVMRLLEVVRGEKTSGRCLATALDLARALNKVPVVVGVCFGFVGNRIFAARDQQASVMLLEGASPAQIDDAMTQFGFPMGPFVLQDMSGGIELTWRLRQETGETDAIGDALYAAGRLGQRAGKGYYCYEPGNRAPLSDPEVDAIIARIRDRAGIEPRALTQQEIIDRMILPMINEAARILDEGIAQRASDIDVVWNTGYGWPLDKGGITWFADSMGLPMVVRRLRDLESRHGGHFTPAPLLERLADRGARLTELPQVRR